MRVRASDLGPLPSPLSRPTARVRRPHGPRVSRTDYCSVRGRVSVSVRVRVTVEGCRDKEQASNNNR